MGISDRTYQQSPPHQTFDRGPRRPSRLDGSPVVKWLLIINVAVWLLDMLTVWLLDMLTNSAPQMQRSFLWSWGHFSVAAAVEQFQLWRFLSFQFLHANGHHLLVNMLGLFFFGHFAERWWGSRKFLFFYLATGVAGALFYVVLFYAGVFGSAPIPIGGGQTLPASYIPMVGASGAISGVIASYLLLYPRANVRVFYWFIILVGTIYVPAYLVLGWWLIQQVLAFPESMKAAGGVAVAAHLGGFASGFVLTPLLKKKGIKLFQSGHSRAFARNR